ncbi:hypothetical protein OAT16_02815 [Prolixibacteraceae bacterium]|nr:hypothetical protein [Prolixibacteraceae bacterium]
MNRNDTIKIAKQFPKSKIVALDLDALDHCAESREVLKEKVKEEKISNVFIPLDGQRDIIKKGNPIGLPFFYNISL